ncbi:MAG: hypothetical protein ACLQBB_06560 [Solirubrobacteraceae bacterium]
MARDHLYAEIARQRESELRARASRHPAGLPAPRSRAHLKQSETVTIRIAADRDGGEVELIVPRTLARFLGAVMLRSARNRNLAERGKI